MRLPGPPILVMIAQVEPAVEFKVWQAIQGGLDMVILRAKSEDVSLIKSTVANMRTALGKTFPIMVNTGGRVDNVANASGSHLPEAAMEASKGMRPKGKGLGISVHSVESARKALELQPDYLLAGTIFESLSHKGESGFGLDHLESICRAVDIPVLAIGGITPENARDCIRAGAAGVSALSPFKGAGREAMAKAYKESMRG